MSAKAPKQPDLKSCLIISLLGMVVAYQSWKAGETLGDSLIFQLGILFALGGILVAIHSYRQAQRNSQPALPAAPSEYKGSFAPDFRRNLEKLHTALGTESQEMILEADYAFWYNADQSIELVLTPQGWMAFFQLADGEHNMDSALVQRAVADSPFANHPVAHELCQKYLDMPLSGIAWCTAEKIQVYPYTSTEDFTLFYAGNLFAPAAVFDAWLPFYLETGMMQAGE